MPTAPSHQEDNNSSSTNDAKEEEERIMSTSPRQPPATTNPPPPHHDRPLSANLNRPHSPSTTTIDSFSLHLNLHPTKESSNHKNSGNGEDSSSDSSGDESDTSDVTWLTYRDEKCHEVKEEFVRRLKATSRVLSAQERRALLEGIVGEHARKEEREKEEQRRRRLRFTTEEEEEESSSKIATTNSVASSSRSSNPHPAALFDANLNFVGVNTAGHHHQRVGGAGFVHPSPYVRYASSNTSHHHPQQHPQQQPQQQQQQQQLGGGGGHILGRLDLVKEETHSDIRAASGSGGGGGSSNSTTSPQHSGSNNEQQQYINQEHINSIVNLKLLVANQQTMIDALTSKLHNAELANSILQSENKILSSNNERQQQQLIQKEREVREAKEQVGGGGGMYGQWGGRDSSILSATSSYSGGRPSTAMTLQEQFVVKALEAKLKQMGEMNKRLVKDNLLLQRQVSVLTVTKEEEEESVVSDYTSGTSDSAIPEFNGLVEDGEEDRREEVEVPRPASTLVAQTTTTNATITATASNTSLVEEAQPDTSTTPLKVSSSSDHGPLKFLREKKNLPPMDRQSLSAAVSAADSSRGNANRSIASTSSSNVVKKKQAITAMIQSVQDVTASEPPLPVVDRRGDDTNKRNASFPVMDRSDVLKNKRNVTFDQKERRLSKPAMDVLLHGPVKSVSASNPPPPTKKGTAETARAGRPYKSQIATSNKLLSQTTILGSLASRLGLTSRLTNRNENASMRVEDLSNALIPLVGQPKFCAMIYNVLTPEECLELIRRAKAEQFEELSYCRRGLEGEPAHVSCCKRCRLSDSNLAADLFERISDALKGTALEKAFLSMPEMKEGSERNSETSSIHLSRDEGDHVSVLKGKRLGLGGPASASVSRISEPFNVIRYDVGEFFAPHRDNTFRTGTEVSRLTVQVFLNEKFTGGVTSIRHGKEFFDVKAKTGSVLLVDQALRREECYVVSGKKYIIRADVMYDESKADVGTAVTESVLTRDTGYTRESGYTKGTDPLRD